MLWRIGRGVLTMAFVWACLSVAPAASHAGKATTYVDVLIGFKTPPGQADRDFIKKQGGTVKHSYWIVPAMAIRVPEQALAGLSKNPNVALVEPDGLMSINDAELDSAWGVKRIGSEAAHLAGQRGTGVKIGVIDTGIDYTHPDLDANYKGGWDFVNNDAYPMDDHGHGTHIAGTIAAEDNGMGVVGVAPNAQLYALKVLDSTGYGYFSNMIAAVQWCVQNGIHVTNNSYGSYSDPGSIFKQAYDNANAAGLVMVAAAGNAGSSGGTEDNVAWPARYSSVVAVAATDGSNYRASWSCTGPAIELAAPGVSINSTMPGGGYGYKSGTSMACPHAVGAAAVLMGAGLTNNDDVRYVLAMSAYDLGAAGDDNWYGFGLIDVPTALSAMSTLPSPDPEPTPDPDPALPGLASVASIGYSMYGGKTNNKNLRVSVNVIDELDLPVPNASVSVRITRSGTVVYTGTAVTDGNGVATFTISNARSGTYATTVTNLSATGYEWDGSSPANSFAK